jgi:trehalose-6-phosphate synthase
MRHCAIARISQTDYDQSIVLKLPWRFQILHALLRYDLIGFQTLHDRRNFVQCIRTLLPYVQNGSFA